MAMKKNGNARDKQVEKTLNGSLADAINQTRQDIEDLKKSIDLVENLQNRVTKSIGTQDPGK